MFKLVVVVAADSQFAPLLVSQFALQHARLLAEAVAACLPSFVLRRLIAVLQHQPAAQLQHPLAAVAVCLPSFALEKLAAVLQHQLAAQLQHQSAAQLQLQPAAQLQLQPAAQLQHQPAAQLQLQPAAQLQHQSAVLLLLLAVDARLLLHRAVVDAEALLPLTPTKVRLSFQLQAPAAPAAVQPLLTKGPLSAPKLLRQLQLLLP